MHVLLPTRRVEIRHAHLFCGLAGGAKGFNQGRAKVGHLEAEFRCIGGIDSDPAAVADFTRLAGVPGTRLDLFSRRDYRAFHGVEPPDGWREATADDIRRAFHGERPHILFTSPPCKGFSGLLSEARSTSEKYQALNRLTVRGIGLALEAFADDPPEFFILENVPRIATRGRKLLDTIVSMLQAAGYSVAETTHDCGELGGLAQTRKRFLLVARHREKVPPFLYEPPRRPLRAVGQVLGAFPLPGDPGAGVMHRMRELQFKTWVRLAFVEAGGDWRSLQKLRVADGVLADYGLAPDTEWHRGALGVTPWSETAGTVTAGGRPGQGRFAVADPRCHGYAEYSQYGVLSWDETARAVSGQAAPGGGRYAVADPRLSEDAARHWNKFRVVDWDGPAGTVVGNAHRPGGGEQSVADPRLSDRTNRHANAFRVVEWGGTAATVIGPHRPGGGDQAVADPRLGDGPRGPHFNNCYRVVRWDRATGTVTAGTSPSAGGLAVADPRSGSDWQGRGKYKVTRFDEPAGAVIAASTTGNGSFAVADPRPGLDGERYRTAGHYGVVPWDASSRAVTGTAGHDNGPFNVADPRTFINPTSDEVEKMQVLPAADARLVAVIRALDGTWHRPFTTLELAALQGLVDPGEHLELEGKSDSAWRERIGNAVPAPAAAAIASVMGTTLLLAWSGETFVLSSDPIWCRRPIEVAVSMDAWGLM